MKFYNTLTHREQEFKPLSDKKISMYVCGPTVYDNDHLGHARTFIIFDVIRRYLMSQDFDVKYMQNITDVGHLTDDADEGEDKIEKRAAEKKVDPFAIAREFEKEHFNDMAALNVLAPDVVARATDHIADFIKFTEKLIAKGMAYEVDGNVYFSIDKFPSYGQLSGRDPEQMLAGARVEKNPQKKNPLDFALWKKAQKNHLMQWDSPWGKGYPGWHIECSAMSQKYLGETLDIHGGAVELVFPHHENEIAQSQALSDKPLANFWLHSGLLTVDGQKMSKSLGNFITIKDVLKEYDADTIRLAVLKTFWRRPFDYTQKALEEASILAKKMARARLEAPEGEAKFKSEINAALDDDFNTPQALTVILENLNSLTKGDFEHIGKVFGLELSAEVKLSDEQKALLKERQKVREEKNFARSDEIREIFEKEGLVLEDTPEGVKVYKN